MKCIKILCLFSVFCITAVAGAEFLPIQNPSHLIAADSSSANRHVAATRRRRRKRRKKLKKRVVIDFQDELIEGSASAPSIFHLFHKKQLNYGRLIKFRKNFLPEMRRTAREL